MLFFLVTIAALADAQEVQQQPPAGPSTEERAEATSPNAITIHGFVDGYYAWNPNSPRSRENFIADTGTTAKRANEISLNLAEVEISREPKPFGFHLALVAGNGEQILHAGEPPRTGLRRHLIETVYQASVLYNLRLGNGLLLEGGIYPSHIGFESFLSKDNWTYTRGWVAELSPYYQTGIKASYRWSDHWSGQLHVLNGWQTISDTNGLKDVGTQVVYTGQKLGAMLNTFIGPALPNDKHLRVFGDLIGTYATTSHLTLAASVDRGHQQLPGAVGANWLGIALCGRYSLDERHAVAARAERFRDPDNGISGTPQTLVETTVTYEYRPRKNVILKVEARRDHSTAQVFGSAGHSMTNHETLAVVGAVVTY